MIRRIQTFNPAQVGQRTYFDPILGKISNLTERLQAWIAPTTSTTPFHLQKPRTVEQVISVLVRRKLINKNFTSLDQRAFIAQVHLLLFEQKLKQALKKINPALTENQIRTEVEKIIHPPGVTLRSRVKLVELGISSEELASKAGQDELFKRGFPLKAHDAAESAVAVFQHLDQGEEFSFFFGSTQSQAEEIIQLSTESPLLEYTPYCPLIIDVLALHQAFADRPLLEKELWEDPLPFFRIESELTTIRRIPGPNIRTLHILGNSITNTGYNPTTLPFCHLSNDLLDELKRLDGFLEPPS